MPRWPAGFRAPAEPAHEKYGGKVLQESPAWVEEAGMWLEEGNSQTDLLILSVYCNLYFYFSRCSWRSQPVRSSRIRKTATRWVLGSCFWTPGWVCADACICYLWAEIWNCARKHRIKRGVSVTLDRTWADQSEGGPDPWKWQSAGSMSSFFQNLLCGKIPQDVSAVLGGFQYGVQVIKYDRRGFKPRPRQLLLTNTFAVLVDRTKIKQRFDYAALRGKSWLISLFLCRLCICLQDINVKWAMLLSGLVHNVSKVLKKIFFSFKLPLKNINPYPNINLWVALCHMILSATVHYQPSGRSLSWGGYSSAIDHSSVN